MAFFVYFKDEESARTLGVLDVDGWKKHDNQDTNVNQTICFILKRYQVYYIYTEVCHRAKCGWNLER